MTRVALGEALAFFMMAAVLSLMAWRRFGVVRQALRVPQTPKAGLRRLKGTLEPAAALVVAPFTERPAVFVRAALRGVGPDGGPQRVLWEKVLSVSAKLCDGDDTLELDLRDAVVLAPREHRQGALRALAPDVRLIPRVLARAGYRAPPPSTQWFYLEEEVLEPGDTVTVIGTVTGTGAVARTDTQPLIVSSVTPFRMLLRLAWGPALALLMGLNLVATALLVLGTWWWLR